ncbi:hypothetical protein [Streptomyces virginiae]|uniref:hypothetical protein n=1 Tax=Streptomyces virginiae TaxID=1961 RepID=UPI003318A57D
MPSGNEVNYRLLLTGEVLSDAIGSDGQLLVDGRELTPAWAADLRETKPAFATLIDVFEEQAAWLDRHLRNAAVRTLHLCLHALNPPPHEPAAPDNCELSGAAGSGRWADVGRHAG